MVMDRYQSLAVDEWLVFGGYRYDSMFYIFFCKPVIVVEGISLRAGCFDEGICKE
jgi:hypothetical protein